MKLSLAVNDRDINRRIWRSIDEGVRLALVGLGFVRIDESGTPRLDELPATRLVEIERACGVRR